jgi:Lhr-like helicase
VQNRFAHRGFIGALQGYAMRLHDALKQTQTDHILLQETRRTVLQDVLRGAQARGYLEKQSRQPVRLLDLPTPSPFAFGLFATSRRDTLQLADTGDFLLAMYEQVQRRLAEQATETAAVGAQPGLFN